MNIHAPSLNIDGIIIPVTPNAEHDYTLTTAEVAAGYGVSPKTIRNHKSNHHDELEEGKHFFGAQNLGSENLMDITHWTKRGIIRLGFFIKSERAKRFRDMAEDLCLREWNQPTLPGGEAAAVLAQILPMVTQLQEFMGRTIGVVEQMKANFENRLSALETTVDRHAMPLLNERVTRLEDRMNLESSLLAVALLGGRKQSFDVPFPKIVEVGRSIGLDDFQIPTGPCRLPGYRGPNSRSMQSSLGKRVSKLLNGRVFLVDGIEWSLVKRGNARGSHYRAIREN